MKTKKLRYRIQIFMWFPNPSKSELSQQASPGTWRLWRDYDFPTPTARDEWLQSPMTKSGISRGEHYTTARASDGNYLYNLKQVVA